ncbi:MAG TPA: hypothetical protein V6C72_13750, partial [Chroococcales cyanobacterium]
MKRVTCWERPNLDELMALALAFDQGSLPLDPYEAEDLFEQLISDGQSKLSPNSALRLSSVS